MKIAWPFAKFKLVASSSVERDPYYHAAESIVSNETRGKIKPRASNNKRANEDGKESLFARWKQ